MRTFLFLLVGALLAPVARAGGAEPMTLLAEANPPLSYVKDGKAAGENVSILTTLFKRAGIPVTVKIETWDKAFETAKKKDGYGVFTTIRTPDREASFQWVGPISTNRWVFLAKKANKIKLSSVEDAFKFKIGGYKDDAKTIFLQKQGGTVDVVDDDSKNAKRLESGQIDLWVTGYLAGNWYAKAAGITDLEEVFAFHEDFGYLALNTGIKASTVLKLQEILDEMKSEGLLDATLKFKKDKE